MSNTFLEVQNVAQDEQVCVWFDVSGSEYAVCFKLNNDVVLLDYEGYPIDSCNDHQNILRQLVDDARDYVNSNRQSREILCID